MAEAGRRSVGYLSAVMFAAVALTGLSPAPAAARLFGQDYERMDVLDGWWVWKSRDGICGTEATNDLGTTFSIALSDRNFDYMIVAVSNSSWRSLQIGQQYPLTLTIDKAVRNIHGVAIHGAGGVTDPTLVSRIERKAGVSALGTFPTFRVALGNGEVVSTARVPSRAVLWVLACAAGSSDPFRNQ